MANQLEKITNLNKTVQDVYKRAQRLKSGRITIGVAEIMSLSQAFDKLSPILHKESPEWTYDDMAQDVSSSLSHAGIILNEINEFGLNPLRSNDYVLKELESAANQSQDLFEYYKEPAATGKSTVSDSYEQGYKQGLKDLGLLDISAKAKRPADNYGYPVEYANQKEVYAVLKRLFPRGYPVIADDDMTVSVTLSGDDAEAKLEKGFQKLVSILKSKGFGGTEFLSKDIIDWSKYSNGPMYEDDEDNDFTLTVYMYA